MTRRKLPLLDLGDRASGRVCDEDRWTDTLPPLARPIRYESGEVVGINVNLPEIVTVRTPRGEKVVIRRG